MALITSAQSGNFNATATWTGGVVPGVGDEARASTGHTITITANATCDEISNAGTGKFVINNSITLTANVTAKTTTAGNLLEFNTTAPAECYIVGNVLASVTNSSISGINNLSSGTINITGNLNGNTGQSSQAASNSAGGVINITGNVTGSTGPGLRNSSSGTIIVTGNVEAGLGATIGNGIWNGSTGTVQIVGSVTASSNIAAIFSTNASSTVRVSGSFIHAANGQVPINSSKVLLWSTPSNSMTRYALNGLGSFVDMFTADNALGQANPTDVRSGVSYASGSLTGSLTVPVRGTISYGVTYGPAMPFTATRSGTTATATLAYSHPYQVGDTFTVSGAFYSDWNGDYTVASVVSGTSITFSVPDTLPASTGAGAVLQTKGTAVLDGVSVASAVWSAASRTITGGVVDTLTNAPTVPTPSQIASQVRTELSTELSRLDVATSTRSTLTTGDLPSVPSAASVASAVRTELTELSNLDASVSSRLASAAYTAPTSAPTAAAVASAVRTELTEISNLDASISSRLAASDYTAPTSAPSASTVASAVRTELGTELGRIDQNISSRLASADYTTPPTTAQISAAVEGSLLNENDGQAVLNAIVGAIGNSNVDEVALVAAIRSDLERAGGKLDSIPTDAAPSAASVASAVWSASTKEITGGTVTTLTNSPDVPTEAEIAAQIRTELSVELGRIDQAISTRLAASAYTAPSTPPTASAIADEVRVELASELANLDAPVSGATAPSAATVATAVRSELATELARVDAAVSTRLAGSAYTAPANSDVAAIKTKTDAINVDRINNTATTAIVGNLLAQANS